MECVSTNRNTMEKTRGSKSLREWTMFPYTCEDHMWWHNAHKSLPQEKKEQGSTTRKPDHLKRKNAAFTPVPFSFHVSDKIPWARTLLKIKLSTAVWEARSFRHETTWFVPRFLQTYSMLILQCDLYLIYVSQFASSERTRENAENGTGRYEIKYNDLQISLCSTFGMSQSEQPPNPWNRYISAMKFLGF